MSYAHQFRAQSLAEKMAKTLFLLSILTLHISRSTESPPKLQTCRTIYKAKEDTSEYTYTFSPGTACISQVILPVVSDQMVNATDPRNCENFYKCTGSSCYACPCPANELFDPKLLKCVPEAQASACVCDSTTTTSTAKTTTESTDGNRPALEADIIVSPVNQTNAEKSVSTESTSTEKSSDEVNNGIIIIAAIVSATVIILVFLVIGFVLWQKGLFVLRQKPQMVPSNNDGYLHTLPTQERHVYAEIDEQMVSEAQERTKRSSAHPYMTTAPPVPGSHPPACIHHPHHTFTLPPSYLQQQRSYHTSEAGAFYSHSPIQASTSGVDNSNNTQYDGDSSSVTSCSGCSHCSGVSGHTQLENNENIDRRTLLRRHEHIPPILPPWNYVSKQVYI